MVNTVAELLDRVRDKALEAVARHGDVGHNGMIGDMYEGLTREILGRAIFAGIDLRVVTGKVRLSPDAYSRQIDAMIVVGEGQQLPFTDHYIYPPEQVIAVVEVKKTLYGPDLDDAYQNLRSVDTDDFMNSVPASKLRFAFRRLAQSELPDDGDLSRLPPTLEMLAATLKWDVCLPIRVVIGYDGYTSELTLRDGFIKYLEKVAATGPTKGYGPANFPNLIVCGRNSLLKLNGMPYSAPSESGDQWAMYASGSHGPFRLLLEILWTRLCSKGF